MLHEAATSSCFNCYICHAGKPDTPDNFNLNNQIPHIHWGAAILGSLKRSKCIEFESTPDLSIEPRALAVALSHSFPLILPGQPVPMNI